MRKLIIILLMLGGCATKDEPHCTPESYKNPVKDYEWDCYYHARFLEQLIQNCGAACVPTRTPNINVYITK